MLLTADQMQAVDACAVAQGIDSFKLMCTAGRAVSALAAELKTDTNSRILVLAGPGNNGGDGFIAATELAKRCYKVCVLHFSSHSSFNQHATDDAERALSTWSGQTLHYCLSDTSKHAASNNTDFDAVASPDNATTQTVNEPVANQEIAEHISNADLIIDALFGAGLSRPLSGLLASTVELVNRASAVILAVDVPSGLDGNTHNVHGPCIAADSTITFFRYKPAHFLYPGRALCGEKTLVQIGLSEEQMDSRWLPCHVNEPKRFLQHLPVLSPTGHKFDRGHVLVRSGPVESTGAARLSASTELNCGAGLVTLATSDEALIVNAAHLTAVMLKRCNNQEQWQAILRDKRISTVLVGPANGVDYETQHCVLSALSSAKHCVLDADALSCWPEDEDKQILFQCLLSARHTAVLTPHAGEFTRLFEDDFSTNDRGAQVSRLNQALAAADYSRAIVVYKGADTVIASPDGRSCINTNAPAWLGTAGSGDVLAGLIASLIAQHMPAFEASCAAVWLHGRAAATLGYPMNAEQLLTQLPEELKLLINEKAGVRP